MTQFSGEDLNDYVRARRCGYLPQSSTNFFVWHDGRLFFRRLDCYFGRDCNCASCDRVGCAWYEHDPPVVNYSAATDQIEWCDNCVQKEVVAIWAMSTIG